MNMNWLRNGLCGMGLHSWAGPLRREPIKDSGVRFLFASQGIQKGVRYCQCCGAEQKCFRIGIVSTIGINGFSEPWDEMSPEKEAYIDRLPVLSTELR